MVQSDLLREQTMSAAKGLLSSVRHAGQEPARSRQLLTLMQRCLGSFDLRNILMGDDDPAIFSLIEARYLSQKPGHSDGPWSMSRRRSDTGAFTARRVERNS